MSQARGAIPTIQAIGDGGRAFLFRSATTLEQS